MLRKLCLLTHRAYVIVILIINKMLKHLRPCTLSTARSDLQSR